MIEKIEINTKGYKVEEPFRKYVEKRIGKLDKYLPRGAKKDASCKVMVSEIGKSKGEKYEISVALAVKGGKVLAAKDECSNVFAGVDLLEAKLAGQIRRYKLENEPHKRRKSLRKLFRRKK